MVIELRGDLGSSCAHVYCSACTAGDSRIHSNPRPLTALLKPALLPRHTANMGMQPLHNGRGSQKRPVRALSREMQGLSRLQHRWIVPAQPIRLAFPNPSPCNLVLGPIPSFFLLPNRSGPSHHLHPRTWISSVLRDAAALQSHLGAGAPPRALSCRRTPYPVPCLLLSCPSAITVTVPLPTCTLHQLVLQ